MLEGRPNLCPSEDFGLSSVKMSLCFFLLFQKSENETNFITKIILSCKLIGPDVGKKTIILGNCVKGTTFTKDCDFDIHLSHPFIKLLIRGQGGRRLIIAFVARSLSESYLSADEMKRKSKKRSI